MDFPHTLTNSLTAAGFPIIKFSSDTIYLELQSDLTGQRAQSHRLYPHFTSDTDLKFQVVIYSSTNLL